MRTDPVLIYANGPKFFPDSELGRAGTPVRHPSPSDQYLSWIEELLLGFQGNSVHILNSSVSRSGFEFSIDYLVNNMRTTCLPQSPQCATVQVICLVITVYYKQNKKYPKYRSH